MFCCCQVCFMDRYSAGARLALTKIQEAPLSPPAAPPIPMTVTATSTDAHTHMTAEQLDVEAWKLQIIAFLQEKTQKGFPAQMLSFIESSVRRPLTIPPPNKLSLESILSSDAEARFILEGKLLGLKAKLRDSSSYVIESSTPLALANAPPATNDDTLSTAGKRPMDDGETSTLMSFHSRSKSYYREENRRKHSKPNPLSRSSGDLALP